MEPKNIDVSVVIPCFRSRKTIRRALDSVVRQTVKPGEVILVDDFSADGTLAELERLAGTYADGWIRVIGLPKNSGPGTARNAGWEAATGKYIAFLDSDDAWHPKKLELQYRWMEMNPDFAMTGHSCVLNKEGDDGLRDEEISTIAFSPISEKQLLLKNFFSTQTVMIRRAIPFRFRSGKKYSEDYLLACEVCLSGANCAASTRSLTYLYKEPFGAGGLSGDLLKMEIGELEVYEQLCRSGKISCLERIFYSTYSFLKFIRRCIYVLMRNIKRTK